MLTCRKFPEMLPLPCRSSLSAGGPPCKASLNPVADLPLAPQADCPHTCPLAVSISGRRWSVHGPGAVPGAPGCAAVQSGSGAGGRAVHAVRAAPAPPLVPVALSSATVASLCPRPGPPGPPLSPGISILSWEPRPRRRPWALLWLSDRRATLRPAGLALSEARLGSGDTQTGRWPSHANAERGPGSCWGGATVGALLFCPTWLGGQPRF